MNSNTPTPAGQAYDSAHLPLVFRKRPLFIVLHAFYALGVPLLATLDLGFYFIDRLSNPPSLPEFAKYGIQPGEKIAAFFGVLAFLSPLLAWGWFCMTEKITITSDMITRSFIWNRPLPFASIHTIYVAAARVVVLSSAETGHMRLTLCCVTKEAKVWEKFLFPFKDQHKIVEALDALTEPVINFCSVRELPTYVKEDRRELRQARSGNGG